MRIPIGSVVSEVAEQAIKRWAKSGLIPKGTAPQVVDTLAKNIDLSKGADIPDVEVMLKGMKGNNDEAFGAFTDYTRTSQVREHINRKEATLTGFRENPEPKYKPFQVDESLPLEEQKRIYKKAASDFIYQAEQAEGKTVPVSRFFKEKGKLRTPDEGELDLKWKTKKDGKKDFQPKLKKTTAKETALRKSREKPWITKKSEIEDILKKLGQEDKLDQLIKLIRSQYNKKVKQIKASGLSKGHQKSLEKGGWDVPENIIGEQGVSTKEVRGNYARQYKEDLPDEELMKQGAFIGTLEEYILMKLKELE